jgi:hypothetical protein
MNMRRKNLFLDTLIKILTNLGEDEGNGDARPITIPRKHTRCTRWGVYTAGR